MRPRLLPTLSLACCLLLCGLWLRSYWVRDTIGYIPARGGWWVAAHSMNGSVLVLWERDPTVLTGDGLRWEHYAAWRTRFPGRWLYIGPSNAKAPHWFPALLTLIPPAWSWVRRKRVGARGFGVATAHGGAGETGA